MDFELGLEERREMLRLGSALVLWEEGEGGHARLDEIVNFATALIAGGANSPATLELAMMPSDPKRLSEHEIAPLLRAMFVESGVPWPSKREAGWRTAKLVAEAMLAGTEDPASGAHWLWSLWEICDQLGEFAQMLMLWEEWYVTIGDRERRSALEAEMLAYAPAVVEAADRSLSLIEEARPDLR